MRQAAVGGDSAGVKEFAAPADDEDEVSGDDGRGSSGWGDGRSLRIEEPGKGGDGEEAKFAISNPAAGEVELNLFAGETAGYVAKLAGCAHIAEPGKEDQNRNHRRQHGASVLRRNQPSRAGADRAKPTNHTQQAGRYCLP